jgi:hypothetical protein
MGEIGPWFLEEWIAETALILGKNSSHNVQATLEAAKTNLIVLATLDLVTEMAGQSQATLDAKRCDLRG